MLFIPVEILVWNLTFKSQSNLGQSLDPSWQCLFLSNLLCYKVFYQVKVLDFHCGCHCYLYQLKFWCGILRLSLRPTWVSPWPKLTVPFFCPMCYVTRFLYQVKVLDFHCGCHCYLFQLKFWCGILRLSLRSTWVSPWPKLTVRFLYLICYVTRFLYPVKVLDFHYGCHCYFFQLKFWCGILRLILRPTWVSPLTQVDSAFFCPICYVTRFLYQVKVLDFHCGCHCYLFQLKFWCGILRLRLRPTWVSPWPKLTVRFFISNLLCYKVFIPS